jgi:hypothetical protein
MSPEGIEIRNITISPTDESKGADLVPVFPETKKK